MQKEEENIPKNKTERVLINRHGLIGIREDGVIVRQRMEQRGALALIVGVGLVRAVHHEEPAIVHHQDLIAVVSHPHHHHIVLGGEGAVEENDDGSSLAKGVPNELFEIRVVGAVVAGGMQSGIARVDVIHELLRLGPHGGKDRADCRGGFVEDLGAPAHSIKATDVA